MNEVQTSRSKYKLSLPDTIQRIKRILDISSPDIPMGAHIAYNVFFFKETQALEVFVKQIARYGLQRNFFPKISQDPALFSFSFEDQREFYLKLTMLCAELKMVSVIILIALAHFLHCMITLHSNF